MRHRPRKSYLEAIPHVRGKSSRYPQTNRKRLHGPHERRNHPQVAPAPLRDIKPANILVAKGVIKIGDFGFAKRNVSRKMKTETSVGTPLYMSTEVLKGTPYTSKCDVWAVGVIFYEMLHKRTPWTAKSVY